MLKAMSEEEVDKGAIKPVSKCRDYSRLDGPLGFLSEQASKCLTIRLNIKDYRAKDPEKKKRKRKQLGFNVLKAIRASILHLNKMDETKETG